MKKQKTPLCLAIEEIDREIELINLLPDRYIFNLAIDKLISIRNKIESLKPTERELIKREQKKCLEAFAEDVKSKRIEIDNWNEAVFIEDIDEIKQKYIYKL